VVTPKKTGLFTLQLVKLVIVKNPISKIADLTLNLRWLDRKSLTELDASVLPLGKVLKNDVVTPGVYGITSSQERWLVGSNAVKPCDDLLLQGITVLGLDALHLLFCTITSHL
jgi:hypothetical protein